MLVGCGNDAGSGTGAPSVLEQTPQATSETPAEPVTTTPTPSPTATATTPAKRTGTVIKSAKSHFGMMLFDGTGQAIYLFDKEQTTKPECYGACAEAWPPVLTRGTPTARGWRETEPPRHHETDRRQDPGDVRQPSAVLLRPRGQERGEVPQHPGLWRPLAGRHPDRTSSCTLTPLRNAAGVKGYPQLRLANPAGLPL